MSSGEELLDGLLGVLDRIGEIVALGQARHDADELVRLALQRLWISAGNYAERHRLEAGLDEGTEPWTELYVYRCVLAHGLPDELSDDRIWEESTTDLERLRHAVRATRI